MPPDSPTGILILDKPLRISSMTAVAIVRRKAGGVKTGHAGTLDPLATGVLVLALGKATKFIDRLMATDKRYLTTIDLSAFTTTDDLEGERSEVVIDKPPSEAAVREAASRFVGRIMQAPPAFAVKIDGRRSYKMARAGEAVQNPPREVVTYAIDVVRYEWPLVELRIHCAKGFYVRSLARELGIALGTGGHCASIRRTAVGPFTVEMARTIEALPDLIDQNELIELERALAMIAENPVARVQAD